MIVKTLKTPFDPLTPSGQEKDLPVIEHVVCSHILMFSDHQCAIFLTAAIRTQALSSVILFVYFLKVHWASTSLTSDVCSI
jgi:hypothetical protein